MNTPHIPSSKLSGEKGWLPIDVMALMGLNRSFVSGDPEGSRLRLAYFRREQDGALVGKAWFGPDAHGPPGFAHGGAIAAVIDEIMGGALFLAGHKVLASQIEVNFKNKIALGSTVAFHAWEHEEKERVVLARAKLALDSVEMATGKGVFVKVGVEHLGDVVHSSSQYLKSLKKKPD